MSAGAAAIARRLGGARAGAGFLCHCPVPTHGKGRGDLRPSLAVSDGEGGLMCHCFAGCSAADVRAAIERIDPSVSPPARDKPELRRRSRRTNTAAARALWRSARPTAGTSAEAYLRTRGFGLSPPASIRFLPSYPYSAGAFLPCLVAAVQVPSREIVAVQLTFLEPSGARKADVGEPRRCIGPLGAGALRLAPAARHIGLAEGLETAWAAMLLHGLPVWAVLGAKRYLKVALPEAVERVTIFADNDAPGLSQAEKFREARRRPEVGIVTPEPRFDDFATQWRARL
ncbi:MAG TPA: toprim domain-containing protein [Methylocystis sp.]|nr:toprim domain-containing protein [Methylocystis sp.]